MREEAAASFAPGWNSSQQQLLPCCQPHAISQQHSESCWAHKCLWVCRRQVKQSGCGAAHTRVVTTLYHHCLNCVGCKVRWPDIKWNASDITEPRDMCPPMYTEKIMFICWCGWNFTVCWLRTWERLSGVHVSAQFYRDPRARIVPSAWRVELCTAVDKLLRKLFLVSYTSCNVWHSLHLVH